MKSTKKLTFVQQNDTHAQFELHWELFWENGKPAYRKAGGFARIATLVREIRSQNPDACLLIDCGDEIHGTGVAQWTEGAAVVPILRAMGVDVLTPGNWEFGFGPEVLRTRAAEMGFPVLACNVVDAITGKPEFAATTVREVGGVRVGLVGITSPIVTERMPKRFGQGLRFLDALEVLPPHIHELRRKHKAELIVMVSHMGLPQDVAIAKNVPGIDIILSSHTHDRLARPMVVGKTILIQSGFSGSFLGRLDVEIAGGQVSGFTHELIEVSESVEPDPAMQSLVNELLKPYRERLTPVVGQTETPLHRMTVLEAPMDNLITDSYLALTGGDVAFSHGWRYGAPVIAGDLTKGDLWQIIPTNPQLFTAKLMGIQILSMLESSFESVFASDPLRQKGGYPVRVSGLNAAVRINNPVGSRIQHLEIGGTRYSPDRLYNVVGAGEQDLAYADEKQDAGFSAIEAIERYCGKHAPVSAGMTNSKFVAI
jgi:sulfur-oxidizing protein SoxB